VQGRAPDARDLQEPAFLARLGGWMARLHALAPPERLPAVDFGERASGYLQALLARRPTPAATGLAARLADRRAALAPVARPASCHHDLHRRNLIDAGGPLMALDWEYAGPGDPAADIAACLSYHDVAPAGLDALLSGYGADTPELRARIAALGWVFDCLWFGWNAVAGSAGIGVDERLQARLLARLAA
jgi:thiamine kinase-like enzyme